MNIEDISKETRVLMNRYAKTNPQKLVDVSEQEIAELARSAAAGNQEDHASLREIQRNIWSDLNQGISDLFERIGVKEAV